MLYKNYVLVVIIDIIFLIEVMVSPQRRIIGGKKASIKNYPYQLCIIIKKESVNSILDNLFRGGAVIVSKYWAFTAAHSIEYIDQLLIDNDMVYLRGNSTDWAHDSGAVDHKIVELVRHPKYMFPDYDFALAKVDAAFEAKFEKPIKVAAIDCLYKSNITATVSGWGWISEDMHGIPLSLRNVQIALISNKRCSALYRKVEEITPRMFCAGKTGKGFCKLDSGGPIVYKGILLGLVCWSNGCASSKYPGIYTKLSSHYKWLQSFKHKNSLGISFVTNISICKTIK